MADILSNDGMQDFTQQGDMAPLLQSDGGEEGGGDLTDGDIARIVAAVVPAATEAVLEAIAPLLASLALRTETVSPSVCVVDADGSPVGGTGASRILIYKGDTATGRQITVLRENKTPFDFTGATSVQYILKRVGSSSGDTFLSVDAEIVAGPGGQLKKAWALDASETSTVGRYLEYWRITRADGRIMTVPGEGNEITIEVRDL